MSAKETQVGGNHYKDMAIQPHEFIEANRLGYSVGCIIKYVCRYPKKGGVEDLRKARHYIELLIDREMAAAPAVMVQSFATCDGCPRPDLCTTNDQCCAAEIKSCPTCDE